MDAELVTMILPTIGLQDQEVEAILYGAFAIHQTLVESGTVHYWYTVTHAPTGRAIVQKLPDNHIALAMVEELSALDIDWREVDNTGVAMKSLRPKTRKALRAILDKYHDFV